MQVFTTDVSAKNGIEHTSLLAAHAYAKDESIRVAQQQRSCGKDEKLITGIYVWKYSDGRRFCSDIWTDGKCMGQSGPYNPLMGEGYAEQIANRDAAHKKAVEKHISRSAERIVEGCEKLLAES